MRRSLQFGPRNLIDEVLGDWVAWWRADKAHGCRYGRVAEALGALDPERHDHLHRLTQGVGERPCRLGDGALAHSGGSTGRTAIWALRSVAARYASPRDTLDALDSPDSPFIFT